MTRQTQGMITLRKHGMLHRFTVPIISPPQPENKDIFAYVCSGKRRTSRLLFLCELPLDEISVCFAFPGGVLNSLCR